MLQVRLAILGLCWALQASAMPAPVTIAVNDYPPYTNQRGEGLVSEILQAAFAVAGRELVILVAPIRRAKVQLLSQQIDAMAGPAAFFSEVEQQLLRSSPIINVLPCWFFYVPAIDNPHEIHSLSDLKRYRVGVIVDSPYLPLYREQGLEVEQIQTPAQLLQMARKGRIDVFESTLLTGLYLIQQQLPADVENFDYIRWSLLSIDLNFLKANDASEPLRREFESGLAAIHASGELLQILERYWGRGNVPQAIFIDQWPFQGVQSVSPALFWRSERNVYGRIIGAPASSPAVE